MPPLKMTKGKLLMDIDFTGHGSLYVLTPQTGEAAEWCNEHLPEDAMTVGRGYAVEHRYISDIVEGIRGDGLAVI